MDRLLKALICLVGASLLPARGQPVVIRSVPTIADLIEVDPRDFTVGGRAAVRVMGKYKSGDGWEKSYVYDRNSSAITNPSLTVLVGRGSVGRWIAVRESTVARVAPTAAQAYALGDSITAGAAVLAVSNSWSGIVARTNLWGIENLAYGSATIPDLNWQAQAGWTITNTLSEAAVGHAPTNIVADTHFLILAGFNDVRDFGTSSTELDQFERGLYALAAHLGIPDSRKRFGQSPTASTGTWSPISWWGAGVRGVVTLTDGSTLTYSNVIGSTVYVTYMAWAGSTNGNLTVSIDGTAQPVIATGSAAYGNREWRSGSDPVIPDIAGPYGNGKIDFCPQTLRVSGLQNTRHTVVITADTANGPVYVLWIAGSADAAARGSRGPYVWIGDTIRQKTWSGSGSDSGASAYQAKVQNVATALMADGLKVARVRASDYYDAYTGESGDTVHPNQTGHTQIATAFLDAMSDEFPIMSSGVAGSGGSAGGPIVPPLTLGDTAAIQGTIRMAQGANVRFNAPYGGPGASITNKGYGLSFDVPNNTGSSYRTYSFIGDTTPFVDWQMAAPAISGDFIKFFGSPAASSGTTRLLHLTGIPSLTGSAAFSMLAIRPAIASVGSGASYLIETAVSGTNQFTVDTSGNLFLRSSATIGGMATVGDAFANTTQLRVNAGAALRPIEISRTGVGIIGPLLQGAQGSEIQLTWNEELLGSIETYQKTASQVGLYLGGVTPAGGTNLAAFIQGHKAVGTNVSSRVFLFQTPLGTGAGSNPVTAFEFNAAIAGLSGATQHGTRTLLRLYTDPASGDLALGVFDKASGSVLPFSATSADGSSRRFLHVGGTGNGTVPGDGAGSGDMLKSTYDPNTNGVVNNSEQLGGQSSSFHLSRANHTGTQTRSTISDFAHATTHQHGGNDEIAVATPATNAIPKAGTNSTEIAAGWLPAATTTAKGAVELATSGENAANVAVQGNDSRLSDARTPTDHASTHQSGGSDAIKLDDLAQPDDNTDLDADITRHGLMRKLPGGTTTFFRGDGTFASIPGGGDMLASTYDPNTNGIVNNSEQLGGQSSAFHLSRANHTGTQTRSTISDFAHATTHQHGGNDEIAVATPATNAIPKAGTNSTEIAAGWLPAATTTAKGAVELATSGENAANVVVQGNDSRLTDARAPTSHASTHQAGGSDPIKLDALAQPDDTTTLDADITRHGLMRKLPGGTTTFFRGDGQFTAIAGDGIFAANGTQATNLVDTADIEVRLTNSVAYLWFADADLRALYPLLSVSGTNVTIAGKLSVSEFSANLWIVTNGMDVASITNQAATASTLAAYDANKKLLSAGITGDALSFSGGNLAAHANVEALADASLTGSGNFMRTRTGVYRTLWIGAGAMTPCTTNPPTLGTNALAGADNMTSDVWVCGDSGDSRVNWILSMPDEWDRGTLKAKILWSSSATSGDVVWSIAAGAASHSDALGAILGTAVNITNTVANAANDMSISSASPAITVGGSPALGDLLSFRLLRSGGSSSDSMSGNALLLGVMLQYQESATEPAAW